MKKKKQNKLKIIIPLISNDFISEGLYKLSEKLGKLNPGTQHHGCLGGTWGYGQEVDNKVFMMHPFCWCDQDDCPWCTGKEPNFRHKKSGVEVRWYKYIGRSMTFGGFDKISKKEWDEILKECFNSLKKKGVKK